MSVDGSTHRVVRVDEQSVYQLPELFACPSRRNTSRNYRNQPEILERASIKSNVVIVSRDIQVVDIAQLALLCIARKQFSFEKPFEGRNRIENETVMILTSVRKSIHLIERNE